MKIPTSDLVHDSHFGRSRRIQSKMNSTPPSIENANHSGQVEVVISLGERDPKFRLELWELIGRCFG